MFWMLPLNSRGATESVTCITMLQVSFSLHCGLNVPICLPRRMNVEFSLCLLTKFFLVHLTLCSLLTTDVEGNFMFDLIKAQSVLWCAQLVLQEVRLCSCLTLLNVNRDVLHLFPQSHYISLYCVCIELVSPCRLGISWRMALWHEKEKWISWNIYYHIQKWRRQYWWNSANSMCIATQRRSRPSAIGQVDRNDFLQWFLSRRHSVVWTVGCVGGVKCCPLCWALVMGRANTKSNPGVHCQYHHNTNTSVERCQ